MKTIKLSCSEIRYPAACRGEFHSFAVISMMVALTAILLGEILEIVDYRGIGFEAKV